MKRSRNSQGSSKKTRLSDEETAVGETSQQKSQRSGGCLKALILKNFMCHSHLHIPFEKNINLITGSNGSGKSAILTGLITGFGGRAALTSRANTMGHLIKNGEHQASVTIILNNEGSNSYKPSEYGSDIHIVRTITETSSTYKFLSAAGKPVARKRDELTKIMEHFGIQADNPLIVMNQESAKMFLKSSSEKVMYSLFAKGTGLVTLKEKYNQCTEKLQETDKQIKLTTKLLDENSKEMKKMEEKMKMMEELKKCENSIRSSEAELQWAKAQKLREEAKETQQALQEAVTTFSETEKCILEKEEMKASLQEELREQESNISGTLTSQQELEKRINTLDAMVSSLKRKLQMVKVKKREELKEIALLKTQEEGHRKEIEKLKAAENSRNEEMHKTLAEKKKLEDDVEQHNAVFKTLSVQRQHLTDTLASEREKMDQVQSLAHNYRRELDHRQNKLRTLPKETDKLSAYLPAMPRILERIKAASARGMFEKAPVGPLGLYVNVTDKQYVNAIETYLGKKGLSSFLVDNSRDHKVLLDILRSETREKEFLPPITVTRFLNNVHDVSFKEVVSDRYKSVYRSCSFSHPCVANCLIDQFRIEQVLLVPTLDDGVELMETRSKVPRNCLRTLTAEGDVFHPFPDYRYYAGQVRPATILKKVSYEELNRIATEGVVETKGKLAKAESELSERKAKYNDIKKNYQKLENEIDVVVRLIERAKRRITVIVHSELDHQNILFNEVVKEWEEQLRKIKALEEKMGGFDEETRKMEEELEKLSRTSEKLEEEKSSLVAVSSTSVARIRSLKDKLMYLTKDKELFYKKDKFQKRIQVLEKKVSQLTEDLNNVLSQAGEEITPERTLAEIEKDLKELKRVSAQLEECLGNTSTLVDEFSSRYENYLTVIKRLERLNASFTNLEICAQTFQGSLHSSEVGLAYAVTCNFKTHLSVKNFEGDLLFRHKPGTLTIKVNPNTQSDRQTSAVDSLSGGERSFSLVSLLISIWDVVKHPFFCIDEFDVFMDPVSRRRSLILLIDEARSKPDCQFVFFTPNAIPVKLSEDISLFRMPEPTRETHD